MTRETKIGLLVGMGVIILIGILISDHLSEAQRQQQAELARPVAEIDASMAPDAALLSPRDPIAQRPPVSVPPPGLDRTPADAQASDPASRTGNPYIQRQHTPAFDTTDITRRERESPGPAHVDVTRNPDFEVRADRPVRRDDVVRIRAAEAGPAGPTRRTHQVKSGERLSDIAKKYYGNATKWRLIAEANKDRIPNPNVVRAGVRLYIPPEQGEAEPTPAPTRAATPAPAPTRTQYKDYKLKRGEYLSTVAERVYGNANDWRKLYAINKDRIADPNNVRAGTVIRIPR